MNNRIKKKTLQLIRDEAALFLGRRPTDQEMKRALPRAQKKLAWIIEREGDAGGIYHCKMHGD